MNSRETAIQIKGKNLDAALKTASEMLGIPVNRVQYEEKKKGFLGSVFSSKIEILAWMPSEKKSRQTRTPKRHGSPRASNSNQKSKRKLSSSASRRSERSMRELEPLTEEQFKNVTVELCEYLEKLAHSISTESISIRTRLDEQYGFKRLIMDVNESEFAGMVNDNEKLRESLEHLVRKKPRHLKRELPFRIFIDGSGQRQAREEELRQLADSLSKQAIKDDKPVILDSHNAYDRKIIHMALDKNQEVYTKSVGMGAKRKLMIIPNSKPHESAQV